MQNTMPSRFGAVTEQRPDVPEFRHYYSHRGLLGSFGDVSRTPGMPMPLDAIAVPSSRRPHNLLPAARTARRARCHLLVLCSGAAEAAVAYAVVRTVLDAGHVTVAHVPRGLALPRLRLVADESPLTRGRRSDTGLKRNIAIAVSRMCGWERLLFLDDDVRGFGAQQLEVLQEALADRPNAPAAVAWSFDDFPDNSIVCHAYRRTGAPQGTFVGGGALAIRVDGPLPHFPLVYNEDWLFMLPLLHERPGSVIFGGGLRQKQYDPYRDPDGATRQEVGDLIAEALFGALHRGVGPDVGTHPRFWRHVLSDRRRLVRHILAELAPEPGRISRRACRALASALEMDHRRPEWPRYLSGWVDAWQADVVRWGAWLEALPEVDSPRAALAECGVESYRPRGVVERIRGVRAGRNGPAGGLTSASASARLGGRRPDAEELQ